MEVGHVCVIDQHQAFETRASGGKPLRQWLTGGQQLDFPRLIFTS